jgi:dTDP-3,4-didehydro-2,6-dideoxy-alpha-D-glucose 3-reductase
MSVPASEGPSTAAAAATVGTDVPVPIDFLILGLSSIVTRRVLPAIKSSAVTGRVDLATSKAADRAVRDQWTHGSIWEDYSEALDRSSAQLVYVSVVNSDHGRWVQAALERGRHVIVDKPAFLGLAQASQMVDLAAAQGVCLAEATVFGYHPQVILAKRLLSEAGSGPSRITMVLSFPPMDSGNFRYRQDLGGGAIWDLGPYLAATSRLFFDAEPDLANSQVVARDMTGLEIAFSALATFSEGRSLIGHFGFDTVYCNHLELISESLRVVMDRAFTTPPDRANAIHVTNGEDRRVIETPPADAFGHFLAHVIARIREGDWTDLSRDLLADSRTLERYRVAAGAMR